MTEIELYWNQINSLSPATVIEVRQDYEGIITVTVTCPDRNVPLTTTGHSTLWQALRTMYLLTKYGETQDA